MERREGTGHFNRAARRGGGNRQLRLPLAGKGAPVLGPCCAMGKHELCAGDCDCLCHKPPAPPF